MRILFLNQYFPPDPAPTGILLQQLAAALQAQGHTVDFVAARQSYHAGQGKGGRMKREIKALATLLWDGLLRPRADVVISASSPPCLLLVATLLALRHRARAFHWIMDLYPEIAVALGEVPSGILSKTVAAAMGWCYRKCEKVIVLDQDMAECLRSYGIEAEIIRPWIFEENAPSLATAGIPQAPWTWIYSGNLGRGHEWQTLLQAQALLEQQSPDLRLLFQGGGPQWRAAQQYASQLGLRHCEFHPYVERDALRESLLRCHCCVVTQLPAVKGMLWPSKLGLLLTLPRPLLWVGPRDGSTARELATRPYTGAFAPGQAAEIADWLWALSRQAPQFAAGDLCDASAQRCDALAAWSVLIAPSHIK
ncbi:MAG: glycosyltransferase [Verrucomicrobia bacterium]|nr:glycosyltransferase [Verrucomicrobiota bacterium]